MKLFFYTFFVFMGGFFFHSYFFKPAISVVATSVNDEVVDVIKTPNTKRSISSVPIQEKSSLQVTVPSELNEDQRALQELVTTTSDKIPPCNIEYNDTDDLISLIKSQEDLKYLVEEKSKEEIKKSYESLSPGELDSLEQLKKNLLDSQVKIQNVESRGQ